RLSASAIRPFSALLSSGGAGLRREVAIKLLENIEGFLSLSAFRNKSFAVVTILNSRQVAMWRAKIFQYPRARAAQEWNFPQGGDLVLVDVLLILLSPSLRSGAVQTLLGIAAEFAHDHRLV